MLEWRVALLALLRTGFTFLTRRANDFFSFAREELGESSWVDQRVQLLFRNYYNHLAIEVERLKYVEICTYYKAILTSALLELNQKCFWCVWKSQTLWNVKLLWLQNWKV